MQIESIKQADGISLVIKESIKTAQDAADIKEALEKTVKAHQGMPIKICINDAFVLPSSVIGSLLRYIEIEKANISLQIKQKELIKSLQKLKLADVLRVKEMV